MKYLYVFLSLLTLILLYIGISLLFLYFKQKKINSRWDKIISQLQRRYDLIPNLIETIKCSVDNEKDIINRIMKSRTMLINANSVDEKANANILLEESLEKIFNLSKKYPSLASSKNYKLLVEEIDEAKYQMLKHKKKYNNIVMEYNASISKYPGKIFASILHYSTFEYFKCK